MPRENIKVTVFRFNPRKDSQPRFQTYQVPKMSDEEAMTKGTIMDEIRAQTILDVLEYIYENLDPTLAYYCACRRGECGACGLVVNGKTVLSCWSFAKSFGNEITIEPLKHLPVVKDLVVKQFSTPELFTLARMNTLNLLQESHEQIYLDKGKLKHRAKERKFIVCNPAKCVDCGICELACSAAKEGVYNPLFSRIHMARIEPEISMSVACCLCQEPECVKVCTKREEAAVQDKETGLIRVHTVGYRCDGCGWCIAACKWGAIAIDPKEGVAIVCDLCMPNEPECIKACPKEALSLATIKEVTQQIEKEETANLVKQVFTDSGNV